MMRYLLLVTIRFPPEQNIQTQMVAFDYGGNKGYSGDGPVSLNMCQNCHITYITNPRSRN